MSDSLIALSMDELRSHARTLWREQNQARLAMLQTFAEIDRRGVSELGLRSLVDLIQTELNCSRAWARSRVREVERFTARTSLTGESLDPAYPTTAAALRDGNLSFEHGKVIADVIDRLPDPVCATRGREVEAALVVRAPELDPVALHKLAGRITALLDPDGPEPKDEQQYRERQLRFTVHADGTATVQGRLTATATATWSVILTNLSGVRNLAVDAAGNLTDGSDELGSDRRTQLQRQHDAFDEAGRLLLANGKLPSHAGLPAELHVVIDLADLETRTGQATTHHGGTLTVQQVLHLAAEMNVIPVILDQELGLVEHGRGRRLASPPQRKAVFARDRGCSFPGCAKSAAQSEVHHMLDWLSLGETNPDNLTITCGYHNNEAPRQGWKAQLVKGIPHWIPPAGRDPERKPIRNYVHHPELLLRT